MPERYIVDFGAQFYRHVLSNAAADIAAFTEKRIVEWHLENMEAVPWMDLYFVKTIMDQLDPVAEEKIKKNVITLPGPHWRRAVKALFLLKRPRAPYEVLAAGQPLDVQEEEDGDAQAGGTPGIGVPPRRRTLADMAAVARAGSGPQGPSV